MNVSTVTETTSRPTSDSDDGLDHIVCDCNDDVAVCGTDVSDAEWNDGTVNPCVVCNDLWVEGTPCPHCGDEGNSS